MRHKAIVEASCRVQAILTPIGDENGDSQFRLRRTPRWRIAGYGRVLTRRGGSNSGEVSRRENVDRLDVVAKQPLDRPGERFQVPSTGGLKASNQCRLLTALHRPLRSDVLDADRHDGHPPE